MSEPSIDAPVLRDGANGGARHRRRWFRRAVIATIVLTALAVGDWYERNREMDHLLDAVEKSESAMKVFQATERDALTEYTNQCSAATAATYECQQAAQTLRMALTDASAAGVVDVKTAGADVEHVRVLPWHADMRAARDAYASHNGAWVRMLDSGATDPPALFDKATQADISATFETANRRFTSALTPVALYDARQRIERIWAH